MVTLSILLPKDQFVMTAEVTISHYLTTPNATVSVGRLEKFPYGLLMKWLQEVRVGDVTRAFEHINAILDASDVPMYVIVDILSKPKFPMSETIFSALRGPYRHENLTAWLIVGENRMARMIESVLSNITRRKNVEWFESLQAALAHIAQQSTEVS
jgi:hypothetical protein